MLHPFIGKVKTKKLGAFSFFDSIIDRLSLWVNMCPDAVILQNTKKKSGHTYTMYMDNEVEGNFIGWGSFIGEDKMGKEKWKNLIVPKDLMLGNIDDSFQVKDELSRLDKVPIFHLLKERICYLQRHLICLYYRIIQFMYMRFHHKCFLSLYKSAP